MHSIDCDVNLLEKGNALKLIGSSTYNGSKDQGKGENRAIPSFLQANRHGQTCHCRRKG
jgi:hypothetical protein